MAWLILLLLGKLKARMVIRDVGRVLGLPYGHVDKISKMIPFDPSRPQSLTECINREPRFKEEIRNNKKVEKSQKLIFLWPIKQKYGNTCSGCSYSWRKFI